MRRHLVMLATVTLGMTLWGCGDAESAADTAGDTDVADSDAGDRDVADSDDPADSDLDGRDSNGSGALVLKGTLHTPTDPLAATDLEACAVFGQTRCGDGIDQRCAIRDVAGGRWVADDDLDPLLRRVLLYDRWYDLFGSPDGQTGERVISLNATPDTHESVWGADAVFERYVGRGDSAIWTGVATTADAYRYAVTGTDADYARMTQQVRTLLTKFDVTGVPGFLARNHFLWMPPGTPQDPDHFLSIEGVDSLSRRDMPVSDPSAVPDLPAYYATSGGTPMWNGRPSIDQYSGPLVAFPIVWPLLRPEDAGLKVRMAEHLKCYLNRLQRIEIRNIQSNDLIKDLIVGYFGGGALKLDPDDLDISAQDTAVLYVVPGVNKTNIDALDTTCPNAPQLEPTRIIDAAGDSFLADTLALFADLAADENKPERPGQIALAYAPTLRGGDASHLMHLAATVYYMTVEEQYRSFLMDELIGNLQTDRVALTTQAFREPDFCAAWYGDHITYPTQWRLATTLGDSPLRDTLARVMHEEHWDKALKGHASAKFNVMYASLADSDPALANQMPARDEVVAQLRAVLDGVGGPVGAIESPRRTYDLPRQDVLDAVAPLGISLRCPTEDERSRCEGGISVAGISFPGKIISRECDGHAGECVMADGKCVDGIADAPLPPQWRQYADFMWQRSPLEIGNSPGSYVGRKQSPGRDLSEPYWMARYYGLVTEGAGQVLAWKAGGGCQ